MSDDWRLRVIAADEEPARELAARLAAFDSEHDLKSAFGDRVVVSRDGPEVFCYANTREQAEAAQHVIQSLANEHGWRLNTELRRWHPAAEQWEDPDQPLPSTDAELATEHAQLVQSEREESRAQGYPDFEVRVRCPSRHEAHQLGERLRAEGFATVQRWEFVVLGVADEDAARELADRIRREMPPGSVVTAEASISEIAADAPLATPFNNPFAVFGGLGV